jgi:hypothetical protein
MRLGVVEKVESKRTPPGANCSTCFANSGDLTRTASCAEYVIRDSSLPTTTSTMGLFIKLVLVSSVRLISKPLLHPTLAKTGLTYSANITSFGPSGSISVRSVSSPAPAAESAPCSPISTSSTGVSSIGV